MSAIKTNEIIDGQENFLIVFSLLWNSLGKRIQYNIYILKNLSKQVNL